MVLEDMGRFPYVRSNTRNYLTQTFANLQLFALRVTPLHEN